MRLIDADVLITWFNDHYDDEEFSVGYISGLIKDAPTIEPQRIKGKWIQDNYYDTKFVCDKCGEPCATYINGKPRDMFCKWCGAEMEMRGEQE